VAERENLKLIHSLLDLAFLAEIVKEMMLPRYYLKGDDKA